MCYLSLLVKEMNSSPWVSIDHQTILVDGYNELKDPQVLLYSSFLYDQVNQFWNMNPFCLLRQNLKWQKIPICKCEINSRSTDHNGVLHMCFEWFLLAFESRDLCQADKRITRESSFPSFNF